MPPPEEILVFSDGGIIVNNHLQLEVEMFNQKTGDLIAALYILIIADLIVVFIKSFIVITGFHPYIMGFIKFSLLATFGSLLKVRRKTGLWEVKPNVVIHAAIWGIIGMWITAAFPGFVGLVTTLTEANMWPAFDGVAGTIWIAFSESLWINFLGGYAFWMMINHEFLDQLVEKRQLSVIQFGENLDKKVWFRFIVGTIFWFWIPAHTITFLLPPEFRILFAAFLSIALGFLTTGHKK